MAIPLPGRVGHVLCKTGVYPNHTYDTENLNITCLRSDKALRPVHIVNYRCQAHHAEPLQPGTLHTEGPLIKRHAVRCPDLIRPRQNEILAEIDVNPTDRKCSSFPVPVGGGFLN